MSVIVTSKSKKTDRKPLPYIAHPRLLILSGIVNIKRSTSIAQNRKPKRINFFIID